MKSVIVSLVVILIYTVSGEETKDDKNEITPQFHQYDSRFLTGIMGGKKVPITKHPYALSIVINDRLKGAAVLLNNQWAITAGFTVWRSSPDQVTVRLASNNAFSGGKAITLKKTVFHPKYTGTWKDDLALIKLEKPIKFSKWVRPIPIAKRLPKEGSNAVVAGWGSQNYTLQTDGILRKAVVLVVHYHTCKQKYESTSSFTDVSFCTSNEDVGPCPLDFGDPLVYRNKLIGIFSGSFDCGSTTYPGVYADVTQYNKWIESVIKSKNNTL